RSGDFAALEGIDEGARDDACPARDVDEISTALYSREELGIEHASCFRSERSGVDHEIRLRRQLAQLVRQADIAHERRSMPTARANGHYFHPERMSALGDLTA